MTLLVIFLTFYCLYSAILVALLKKWMRFFADCLTVHLPHEIKLINKLDATR